MTEDKRGDIDSLPLERRPTGIPGLDAVLRGGLVRGATYLTLRQWSEFSAPRLESEDLALLDHVVPAVEAQIAALGPLADDGKRHEPLELQYDRPHLGAPHERWRDIPVIMMSAVPAEDIPRPPGVVAVADKPIRFPASLSRVRQILGQEE